MTKTAYYSFDELEFMRCINFVLEKGMESFEHDIIIKIIIALIDHRTLLYSLAQNWHK